MDVIFLSGIKPKQYNEYLVNIVHSDGLVL